MCNASSEIASDKGHKSDTICTSVAPVQLGGGGGVAGVPAAWAAPPLSRLIVEAGDELPPV